ncbi:MAG: NTP transferase domain-containing protein [Parvularculaceae bacterium]|nr:NTP transferase domain-containing protein [Parvularculaceae bacterium]
MAVIKPIVMAGGSGTRLWPLSKSEQPKQYQPLLSHRTMLEETLARVSGASFAEPAVIGGLRHRSVIEAQLPSGQILLEPFGRDTGPAAISAALLAAETDPEALVLLLPADHHIADVEAFRAAIERGVAAAEQGYLVTLGITPDAPETGFGYIRRGAPLTEGSFKVEAFVEKPQKEVAEQYLASGDYAWNAGIFLFRPSDLIAEAKTHAGEMFAQTKVAFESMTQDGRVRTFQEGSFGAIKGKSVDYAIMEQTEKAAVVSPVVIGWNDIGSWTAVKQFSTEMVPKNAIAIDCPGTLIKTSDDAPFVGAVGLEGYVVVATKESVLIIPDDRTQDVKKIVEELKARDRKDQL